MTTITKNNAGQKPKENATSAGGNAAATKPDPATNCPAADPTGSGTDPILQPDATAGDDNAPTGTTTTPAGGDANGVKPDPVGDKPHAETTTETTRKAQETAAAKKASKEKEAVDAEKARKEAEAQAKRLAPFKAIAQRYAPHYPACKEFHITSDRMVFLEGNKAEAEAHQRELPKGEVVTIKTE